MRYLAYLSLGTFLLWAIGGYWIAPDSSSLAAQQIPELAQKPPFFSAYLAFLKNQETSYWARFWQGQPSTEVWVLNDTLPFQRIEPDSFLLHLQQGEQVKVSKYTLRHQEPVHFTFYLGTDPLGRDIFSRLIIGTRYSLSVALCSIAISVLLGVGLGLVAGYFGGIYDSVISWWMSVFWALPSTLLAIGIAFAIGKGFFTLVLAIGFVLWVDIARIVRIETLRLKEKEFIKAAQTLGLAPARIILFHILPNLITPTMVVVFSTFTTALILEGSLSFLGLGMTPPAPSWGSLIFDGFYYIVLSTGKWLLLAPAGCLILTVLSIQYLAEQWKKKL